ncbi:hypothetical protein [uncultured Ruegeria sp.]|uniref:hypothetical protein n=1 Tax=uncultured Ruegeria sp. TaxID=259304 RepID=UPI002606928F|nr:hypothetical protein [uncultured Ruegeria sp.]
MSYSATEQEVIVLNAAWGMIDDMVNHATFQISEGPRIDTNLLPQSECTLRLFNILLTDFLSPLSARGSRELPFGLSKPPADAGSSNFTFLFYLKQVCRSPQLGSNPSALKETIDAFSLWLEAKSSVAKVLFTSVSIEVDLEVERREWIRICGDSAKHNFARLETNVAKIVRILKDHEKSVEPARGYELLPEFFDRFHNDIFAYHASTIAEFLNNIRLELHAYLKAEFCRSFSRTDKEAKYKFEVPKEIEQELARSMYWELMNRCKSEPLFPKFTVTEYLKNRY